MWNASTKQLQAFFLLVLLLSGCPFRHTDYGMTFHLKGNLKEKTDSKPLDNVQIFFIDTGFTTTESKLHVAREVGKSDHLGNIDLMYHYGWGRDETLFSLFKAPAETFEIEFFKDSYQRQRLKLRASDFPRENNVLKVSLGTIYFEKVKRKGETIKDVCST